MRIRTWNNSHTNLFRRSCGRFPIRCFLQGLFGLSIATGWAIVDSEAEEFILKNGGVLHGKWIKDEKSPPVGSPDKYIIETEAGMRVILNASQVKHVDLLDDRESKYELSVGTLDDSVSSHRKWVDQLTIESMESVAKAHRERIVELDPSDKGNWTKLGYREDSNKEWVREEILAFREGLVFFKGRPRIPQDIAIDEMEKDIKAKQGVLKDKIDIAFRNEGKTGRLGDEARQALLQLNDPLAIMSLSVRLEKAKNESVAVRFRLIEMLSKYQKASAPELFKCAIEDPDPGVRDRCIDHLKMYAPDLAVARCIAKLKANSAPNKASLSPDEIDRIGNILSAIPDERALRPLIDALKTSRLETITVTPGAEAGPNGMGLSRGGRVAIPSIASQSGILEALLKQSSDENFQFDQAKWREWYARTHASTGLDLRRDP